MKELDIVAEMTSAYKNDLPNAWERVKNYYQNLSPETLKGIKGLDPQGNTDFYAPDYGIVISDFNYTSVNPSFTPNEVADQTLINNGTTTVDETFSFKKASQDNFKFGFSEGLKVGTKASAKVKLPFVGEGTAEVSAEITFNANQEWSKSNAEEWTYTTRIPVPPNSKIRCTGFIKYSNINCPFTANVKATDGMVLTWFQLENGTYTEFPVPLTILLTEQQRTFQVSGKFDGGEGVSVYSQIDPINN
ncbi:MAG TPA: ETX/MTX2 family pore-forming toxin [Parafilimonas sp.]|nr:ETX/MTX2 family pore-forming toxin [Parafilimonas sp.]